MLSGPLVCLILMCCATEVLKFSPILTSIHISRVNVRNVEHIEYISDRKLHKTESSICIIGNWYTDCLL